MNDFDIKQIMQWLPHRYPMLLIDRVLSCDAGQTLTAIKNVTLNEHFFQGHFPGQPVMPGVLILESMAQATGILAFHTRQDKPDARQLYLLVSVDKARFKRPVVPGDQVILTVSFVRRIKNMMKFNTTASVDDKVVASAQIMCASKEYES